MSNNDIMDLLEIVLISLVCPLVLPVMNDKEEA